MMGTVRKAVEQSQMRKRNLSHKVIVEQRLSTLTPREREIMGMVIEGKLSKVIAAELGISLNTVEVHRGRIMKKMQAQTPAELVRMVLDSRYR
jgi:FixJ family two-component response regulator